MKSSANDAKQKTIDAKQKAKDKILNRSGHVLQPKNVIDQDQIIADFELLLEKHPDMGEIHKSLGADGFYIPVLKAAVTPFILERISIFSELYPQLYSQNLFCSWLAALIARNLKLDGKTATKIVRAALARDIGLLYLPLSLLDSQVKFTSNDWNAMKTHTIIGQMVSKDLGGIGETECIAIMQHHERYDGMGYPKRLKGEEISLAGQIVAAVDMVGAVRFKSFQHSGRNLRDVFAYVQMNEDAFSPKVIKALFQILTSSNLEKTVLNPFKTIDQLISHLYVRGSAMSGSLRMMQKLMDILGSFRQGTIRDELMGVTANVLKIIHQSGVLDDKMITWLNKLAQSSNAFESGLEELSELEFYQNELYWQLKRVSNLLQSFYDLEMKVTDPSAQTLITILHCLNQQNLPQMARYKK